MPADPILHLTHWGVFEATSDGRNLTSLVPYRADPEPYGLMGNIRSSHHHPTRIDRPHVRAGWLDDGPGPSDRRGRDRFVPVEWSTVTELLADEYRRVYAEHGPAAVFGGSYGWASAGRFHHAQSQIHRFLNCIGGYVRSVNNYSFGASQVLLPHVIGDPDEVMTRASTWQSIAANAGLVVAFGGLARKNAAASSGGVSKHDMASWLERAHDNGTRFALVSPLRDDAIDTVDADWIEIVPGTDSALMLALAHTLMCEELVDLEFIARCTVGFDAFADYVLGRSDGVPKSAAWAGQLTGVAADRTRALARAMATTRTMITVSWSMQRQQYGEQPLWLGITLAAMLGQLGLPGGGFGHGYASSASIGHPRAAWPLPTLPQGSNPVREFIPVARIADMLLDPGGRFDYDGRVLTYPNIKLVHWAGGNPFHHHQDLKRLARAFGRPDTVVVNDCFWTSTARHADIVLPSTMSIERDDIGGGRNDDVLFAMRRLVEPHESARDDYEIFAGIAGELGCGDAFTENRDASGWLWHMYSTWRESLVADGADEIPDFDSFWAAQHLRVPTADDVSDAFADFRRDPDAAPLRTPSGRIEITSQTIASFGYPDCPGHPVWLEPDEWLGSARAGRYPLQLLANQPATRLHSQLDVGEHSRSSKVHGREPVRMHPIDAAERGLRDGDVVRLYNDRGACLAGVRVSDELRPGVVQLSTGAWYDPDDDGDCRHGNPNVLTADVPTSRLAQACTGQHALIEIEAWTKDVPALHVLQPPPIRDTS